MKDSDEIGFRGVFPFKSVVTVDRPENWAGVTPFTDPQDGSKWYGVRRHDLWWMLVLSVLTGAFAAFSVETVICHFIGGAGL